MKDIVEFLGNFVTDTFIIDPSWFSLAFCAFCIYMIGWVRGYARGQDDRTTTSIGEKDAV